MKRSFFAFFIAAGLLSPMAWRSDHAAAQEPSRSPHHATCPYLNGDHPARVQADPVVEENSTEVTRQVTATSPALVEEDQDELGAAGAAPDAPVLEESEAVSDSLVQEAVPVAFTEDAPEPSDDAWYGFEDIDSPEEAVSETDAVEPEAIEEAPFDADAFEVAPIAADPTEADEPVAEQAPSEADPTEAQ
ncbi:MAG: hypothetical protein N2C14_00945, partial [Planctomycetales bacterium]